MKAPTGTHNPIQGAEIRFRQKYPVNMHPVSCLGLSKPCQPCSFQRNNAEDVTSGLQGCRHSPGVHKLSRLSNSHHIELYFTQLPFLHHSCICHFIISPNSSRTVPPTDQLQCLFIVAGKHLNIRSFTVVDVVVCQKSSRPLDFRFYTPTPRFSRDPFKTEFILYFSNTLIPALAKGLYIS